MRKVLVTGATSGIGAGIAAAFAADGAQVWATGATAAEVDAAMAAGPDIEHRMLDVRDGDAAKALLQEPGELDVVVNCAGIIRRGQEHEPEAFAQTVDVNLNGTMRVCAAARAGLDRDAADAGAAGRPDPQRADPGAHTTGPLGHAR